jgi:hypothetical protein
MRPTSFMQMPRAALLSLAAAAVVLAQGCAYNNPSATAEEGAAVGVTGGVEYSHKVLAADRHFLTVSVGPGYLETEPSMANRLDTFANTFAAKTCPVAYEFVRDPNVDDSVRRGWWKRTRDYVFVCRQ